MEHVGARRDIISNCDLSIENGNNGVQDAQIVLLAVGKRFHSFLLYSFDLNFRLMIFERHFDGKVESFILIHSFLLHTKYPTAIEHCPDRSV